MRILMTGGAGFIGSSIVDEYITQGHDVLVFDNLESGKKRYVNPGATFVLGDILDDGFFDAVRSFMPHIINHHAGLADIGKSFQEPDKYLSVILRGTLNVALAAEKFGAKKIIYGSAASPVYGPDGDINNKTEDTLLFPQTPYGVYVAASEMLLKSFERRGVNSVCLRYANVYGPRQDPYYGGVVAVLTGKILKEQIVLIYDSGWQRRDFISIRDVVKANLSALDYGDGESINICTGVETSIRSLFELLTALTGKKSDILFQDSRHAVSHCSGLSNNKSWEVLGWSPTVSLEVGLAAVIDYFLEENCKF